MGIEGEGSLSLPIHNNLARLEMVLYMDREPIPLDWSKAMEDEGGDDSQVSNKEVELIMAFSQIVGVSYDGYIEKLKVAFAHFWLVK